MVVGDFGAQRLECWKHTGSLTTEPFDAKRTSVMAAYSGAVFTPIFFYLYKALDRGLRGPPMLLAAQKAVGSVIVGGLPCNIIFLWLGTTIEVNVFGKKPASGESLEQVVYRKIRDDLPRLMLGSLAFWGPVNFCNFYWAPPQYRIMVVSASAVVWNCYLSLVQHEYVHETEPSLAIATNANTFEKALEAETRKSVVYWSGETPADRK
jgi:hypothetical protein